jgi:hypothetical protein
MENWVEYLQKLTNDRMELDARYERIDQAWARSEIPDFVLDTPDWQSGWEVLLGWLGRHVAGTAWPWPPRLCCRTEFGPAGGARPHTSGGQPDRSARRKDDFTIRRWKGAIPAI